MRQNSSHPFLVPGRAYEHAMTRVMRHSALDPHGEAMAFLDRLAIPCLFACMVG